jgi:hypothetical protein
MAQANNPPPDPRYKARKDFMKEIAEKIAKEAEKIKKETSKGRKLEMESSEVFKVYMNDKKPMEEGNRLINLLDNRQRTLKSKEMSSQNLRYDGILHNPPFVTDGKKQKFKWQRRPNGP